MTVKITVSANAFAKERAVRELANFEALESEVRDALRDSHAVVSRGRASPGDPDGAQEAKKNLPTVCWADGRQSEATRVYAVQLDNDRDNPPISGARGFRFESPRSKPGARRWKEIYQISRPLLPGEAVRVTRELATKQGADDGATPAAHPCFLGRFEGDPERAFESLQGVPLDVDAILSSLPPEAPRATTAASSDLYEPVERDGSQGADALLAFEEFFTPGKREPLSLRAGVYLRRQGWTREDAAALWEALVQSKGEDPSCDYAAKLLREWDRAHAGVEGLSGADGIRALLGEEALAKLDAACRDDRYGPPLLVEWRKKFGGLSNNPKDGSDLEDSRVDQVLDRLPSIGVYQAARRLVAVSYDYRKGNKRSVEKPKGSPMIAEIAPARLEEIASGICGEKGAATIARRVAGRPEWPAIPYLEGLANCPVLRPDGTILHEIGYDHGTGLYVEHALALDVPEEPTHEQARLALQAFQTLLGDFDFLSEAHLASWLCGLLAVLARSAIEGPIPAVVLEAARSRSGKSLLAELIGVLLLGAEPGAMNAPSNNEEWDKRLLATFLEGHPVIHIDNVKGILDSSALEAALTSPDRYSGRVLGVTKMAAPPVRAQFLITANNVKVSKDLVGRSVLCRIEPTCERPELRSDFQIPDLKGHVKANRAHYLSLALTMLRAHVIAGRPATGLAPLGKFEAWSRVVRDCIVWSGGADAVSTQAELRESAAVQTTDEAAFFAALDGLAGDAWLFTRDILDLTNAVRPKALVSPATGTGLGALDRGLDPELVRNLKEAAEGLLAHGTPLTAKALGHRMGRMKGACEGGLWLWWRTDSDSRLPQYRTAREPQRGVSRSKGGAT